MFTDIAGERQEMTVSADNVANVAGSGDIRYAPYDVEVRAGVLQVSPDRHGRGAEDPRALQAAQGRVFGSLLTGMVEGMLPMIRTTSRMTSI